MSTYWVAIIIGTIWGLTLNGLLSPALKPRHDRIPLMLLIALSCDGLAILLTIAAYKGIR